VKLPLATVERAGLALYAGAFAVLPILADHHVISEWVVSAVGVTATAVVGAWTGGKIVTAPGIPTAADVSTDTPVI